MQRSFLGWHRGACVGNDIICCKKMEIENDLANVNVCGRSPSKDNIKGGRDAGIFDYPWMAVLEYRKRK